MDDIDQILNDLDKMFSSEADIVFEHQLNDNEGNQFLLQTGLDDEYLDEIWGYRVWRQD